ncbi:MAG TPA: DUF2889 domain-containing protein [Magnetospirillaceae bacterium]|nr:DUF2889 domain-containing protein [Magnetospirillaceae bacterium]
MGKLSDRADQVSNFCIHTRTIETSTYPVDDAHVLSVGRLMDLRHARSYGFTGRPHEAGPFHDLEVFLLLQTSELVIEDIEVRIRKVPRKDCEALERSLDAAIGLRIGAGFTEKSKVMAGRGTGCIHLAHLLAVMAPAVLQGCWALADRDRSDPDKTRHRAVSASLYLKDSCHTWRAEGDAYRELLYSVMNPVK